MLYLSDKISVSWTPTNLGSYVNYTVEVKQYGGSYSTIYTGRLYAVSNTPQYIYLNEIIESYTRNFSLITPAADGGIPAGPTSNGILQKFRITINGTSQETPYILSYYKDPNEPIGSNHGGDSFPSNPVTERSSVYPRVPHLTSFDNKMFLGYVILSGGVNTGILSGSAFNTSSDTISVMGVKVADVDQCPADYYAVWLDRTNTCQCQPFNKAVYSESISNTYRYDRFNEPIPYNIKVKGSWQLTTGYVSEEQAKIYESMATSPYVYIYDVKNDCGYWGSGVGSYSEKQKRRDKKLINQTITLSAVEQNIRY